MAKRRLTNSFRVARTLLIPALSLLVNPDPGIAENSGFVQVSGTHFMLNGRRVYFAGANNYYQMIHRRTGQPGVDEVLDEMAARSMTVLRTWAFQDMSERNDCLQCAPVRKLTSNKQPVDFIDPATLAALDQVLAAADQRNIRVVLTLVNNWDDYGGMNRYALWRFGTASHDRFYTDATIRGWFKALVQLLITRVNTVNGRLYRDDPTIFAWQLTNEARLMSTDVTPADLDAWMGEMSAHIKSLDSNHLVSTGIEGFYGPAHAGRNTDSWMASNGQDFINNHQHATIDYATCHVWPQNWGWGPINNPDIAVAKATQYVQNHLDDATNVLKKPLMMDEFGIPRDNFGVGINSGPNAMRQRFYHDVYYTMCESSARSGGTFGGTAIWIILDDPTASYDDGNGVFLPSDVQLDTTLTDHARLLASLVLPDLDGDGDVDTNDLARFQACAAGPAVGPPAAGCEEADLDRDLDVDQSDFGLLQRCLSGKDVPADPHCTD